MSARLTIALIVAGLLALPSAASAATKHGVTPLAPKAGKSVPAGKSVIFKMRVKGKGQVYVHVCKSKKKDKDGVICFNAAIGRAHKKGGVFRYTSKFADFPTFWLNTPGTYYWQAFRIACEGSDISDCSQEGPITRFKVVGG
jgi:hypothetical protein